MIKVEKANEILGLMQREIVVPPFIGRMNFYFLIEELQFTSFVFKTKIRIK
jgi:hypothetical protein